ncbi:MAG: PilZ domain-containing protein [Thermodesulfobacteriota bacterium]
MTEKKKTETPKKGDGKRRFTRVPFHVRTRIDIEDRSHTVDRIFNLSVGGCLLPLPIQPNKGTPCRLEIQLGDNRTDISVQVEGEVIRSGEGTVAVKFIRIDPDSLFHLQNIILYNAPNPEEVEKEIDQHPGIF